MPIPIEKNASLSRSAPNKENTLKGLLLEFYRLFSENISSNHFEDIQTLNIIDKLEIVQKWRKLIFIGIFTSFLFFITIPYITSSHLVLKHKMWINFIVYSFSYFSVFIIVIFTRIPFRVKLFIGLLSFYCLGLIALITVGSAGSGKLYLLSSSIIATLLAGARFGLFTVFLNTFIIIVLGYFVANGDIDWIKGNPLALKSYTISGATFIFLNATVTISLAALVRALEKNLIEFQMATRELKATNDELLQNQNKREELETQLQQAIKMEAIGTLAGGVAHDFNNLLQAINGYTQLLLLERTGKEKEHSYLKAIEDAGFRASELVDQLLLISRKTEPKKRPIEIQHEVENAQKMLARTIPKMVEIQISKEDWLWAINADPIQVEQILLNLGTNAADAMPDGGRLIFEIKNITLDDDYTSRHLGAQPGRYVLLTISDTGHGMDRETQEKIFEPFFTTKEFGKGTGLGLASVYGIVKSHGGYITCYSELGQGTTFKIYLPAMEQPEEKKEERDVAAEPPTGRGETILLVDDEEAIRGFAQQALMKFGYEVVTASTGEEGFEVYQNQAGKIDLVITDIGMPGMGGHKFLQELLQINPEAKVLIASGYSINGQLKKSMEAGAKGYVGKPYQLADLLKTVRDILDEEN